MAICSRCGNYAPDGTVMCPVCGTPFPPMQQMTPPPVPGAVPNIPNIPSADAIGTMATGGLKQAATQAVRQFTGGIDLMATETQGEIVLSSWKMPTSVPSVVQMGASAVQKATKGKYAWMWFLIPAFTILAWVITQLVK